LEACSLASVQLLHHVSGTSYWAFLRLITSSVFVSLSFITVQINNAQVFNEICSRRINDEYDFFSGLITNPTFMSVLIITVGLQAIIINFLGIFFKVSL